MLRDTFIDALAAPLADRAVLKELEADIYREFLALQPNDFSEAAASLAAKLSDLERLPSRAIACKKGCGHCCKSQRILVEELEVIRLVRSVDASMKRGFIVEQLKRSLPTSAGGGPVSTKCSMLSMSDECMVHDSRPITCMTYVAFDRLQCKQYAAGKGGLPDIPVIRYLASNAFYDVVLPGVRERAQVGKRVYELNSILKRIFNNAALVAAWSSGAPSVEEDLLISPAAI